MYCSVVITFSSLGTNSCLSQAVGMPNNAPYQVLIILLYQVPVVHTNCAVLEQTRRPLCSRTKLFMQCLVKSTLVDATIIIIYIYCRSYRKLDINRVGLLIMLHGKLFFFVSPFAPESLVSRDKLGRPAPRQPEHSPHPAESFDTTAVDVMCSIQYLPLPLSRGCNR